MNKLEVELLPIEAVNNVSVDVPLEALEKYREDRTELARMWREVGLYIPGPGAIAFSTGVTDSADMEFGLCLWAFNELSSLILYMWDQEKNEYEDIGLCEVLGKEYVIATHNLALALRLAKLAGIL